MQANPQNGWSAPTQHHLLGDQPMPIYMCFPPSLSVCHVGHCGSSNYRNLKLLLETPYFGWRSIFRHEIDIPNSEYIYTWVFLFRLQFSPTKCADLWVEYIVSRPLSGYLIFSEICCTQDIAIGPEVTSMYVPSIALALRGHRTYVHSCASLFGDLVLNAWSWLVQSEDEIIFNYKIKISR